MEFITLSTESRTRTGKGVARSLRREGKIPAVLYGRDTDTRMLTVNVAELENNLKKHSAALSVFQLKVQDDAGQSEQLAMLKELQDDPVTGQLQHADFYRIDLNRKVSVQVPLSVVGKSKGVELGGVLQIVRRELPVLCLPDKIPHSIEVDVTDVGVGEALHVEDLRLDEGVEIPHDTNFTLVTVLSTRKAGGEAGAEEAGEGEAQAAEA